jgi:outer membrane protein insertion porin family
MRVVAITILTLAVMISSASAIQVGRIDVEGNYFVSAKKIQSILGILPGEQFMAEKVSQGIKRLVRTKDFADAIAYYSEEEGRAVIRVVVKEYPRVRSVSFEGNDKVKDEDISGKVSLREGSFARPATITKDASAITELYSEKGYTRASVEVRRTDSAEQNKIDVTYAITEGKKVKIRHIDLLGNGAVSSESIKGSIESKEDRWYRGGDYKPSVLREDLLKIKELYENEGYLDALVEIDHLEEVEDGRKLDIYIRIDEGMRFYVGDVSWSGNEEITDEEIEPLVALKEGDPFSTGAMEMTQMGINSLYWEKGYIWSKIIPNMRNRRRMIDLDLGIVENNPASINEIKISGNTKTFESVIRRELDVYPGDRFILNDVQRSVREIFQLGYFNGPPKINTEPVGDEGDINLLIEVEEKTTGNFRGGFGFSQLNKLSGFVGIQENNFLGRGKSVGIDWEFGKYRTNLNLRFTEPYLLGTQTSLTLNVFNWIQDRVSQQYYRDRRAGFSIRAGHPFPVLDYTRFYLSYRFEKINLTDFDESYPETGSLRLIGWPLNKSTMSVGIIRNSTDSPFHPTRGSIISWNTEVAGGPFGGNVQFIRNSASLSYFMNILWKLTLHLSADVANITGFGGSKVEDYEKYRLGGNRRFPLRGYDFYEVVPVGNDPYVGGTFMTKFTQELVFPFSQAIYGLVFFDAGNTWNSMTAANPYNLRKGLGIGVRLEVPGMGNLGFDYGYGYDKIGGPGWEPHFTFGTFF